MRQTRLLRRFLEGFSTMLSRRVLGRVLRRCLAMGFRERKGSERMGA